MKMLKQIILACLVMLFALGNCLAQDDVYAQPDNSYNNKTINSGYVFINGKYINVPYTVKRKGLDIYVNGELVYSFNHKLQNERIKKQVKYKVRPPIPQILSKNSNTEEVLYAVDSIYKIPYFNSIKAYFYSNFEYSNAIDSIIHNYLKLPCVKNIEKKGDKIYTIILYNEEAFDCIIGGDITNNRYANSQKNRKKTYVKKSKSLLRQINKSLELNNIVYFFNDNNRSKVIYSYNSINCIRFLYDQKYDEFSNAQLEDSLVNLLGNRPYMHFFTENLLLNDQFFERAKDHIYNSLQSSNINNKLLIKDKSKLSINNRNTTTAYSPSSNEVHIYCPYTWDAAFSEFDSEITLLQETLTGQGYVVNEQFTFRDDLPNDVIIFEQSAKYENLINMKNAGVVLLDSHGFDYYNASTNIHTYYTNIYVSSDIDDIEFWCDNDPEVGTVVLDISDWPEWDPSKIIIGAVVGPEWFQTHWKTTLTNSNSIVIMNPCFSGNEPLLSNYGGGVAFGYEEEASWLGNDAIGSGQRHNTSELLNRMNGEIKKGKKRIANDAFDHIYEPNYGFVYYKNQFITLCPSTKDYFPENNQLVPPSTTQGYFELDTWCLANAEHLATDALTITSTGDIVVSEPFWDNMNNGESNMITFNWTGNEGSVTVNVNTSKIVGSGGQKLDFDGKTPNGETNIFYDFYIGTGTYQFVDFFVDNGTILENTTVQFTDLSFIDNPISYLWDFGDGTTSNLQNPEHTYTDEGVYSVRLTIQTPIGTKYENKTSYISVSTECTGDLYCSNYYVVDKTVEFFLNVSGAFEPSAFEYRFTFDFGDGDTYTDTDISSSLNVEHDYSEFGEYETSAIVETLDQFGEVICLKECSCNTVDLYDPFPCSDFSVEVKTYPELVFVDEPVQISAEIYDGTPPYQYHWAIATIPTDTDIFYDGFTSTDESIEYPYPQEGTYPVFLSVVSGEGCNFQTTYNINVVNKESCIADMKFYVRIDGEMKETNHFITKQGCTVPIFFEYDFLNNWFCNNDSWNCKYPDKASWYKNSLYNLVMYANEGYVFEPFYFHSLYGEGTITNSVQLTNSGFTANNDEDNPDPYLCDRWGKVYADVVNCNNIAHEDNYAYPSYAFIDAINNPPYYSSGSFNLDSEVNTFVNENTTIFTACNGIILSEGFRTGNKPFIATGYGFADCYSPEVNNESKAIAESFLISCDVFPNPFKDCSNFELHLPYNSNIKIDIYDLNGSFITNILSNSLFSGDYNIDIDLKNHPPGIYYLRILENNLDFKTIKLTKM